MRRIISYPADSQPMAAYDAGVEDATVAGQWGDPARHPEIQ